MFWREKNPVFVKKFSYSSAHLVYDWYLTFLTGKSYERYGHKESAKHCCLQQKFQNTLHNSYPSFFFFFIKLNFIAELPTLNECLGMIYYLLISNRPASWLDACKYYKWVITNKRLRKEIWEKMCNLLVPTLLYLMARIQVWSWISMVGGQSPQINKRVVRIKHVGWI